MDPTKHVEQNAGEIGRPGETESFAFPVSFAQGRLWLLSKLTPNSTVYNIPMAVRLRGPLDIEALRASFAEILKRHEVLRASFQEEDGSPVQVIPSTVSLAIPLVDVSHLPTQDAVRSAQAIAQENAGTGFDLSQSPLLRASVVKIADQDHVLTLNIHHIIYDAWSRSVLWRELSEYYRGFTTGHGPNLPELEIQYTDFSVWQRDYLSGETLEEQLQFWKKHLAGAPTVLELQTDRPRPVLQTFNGTEYGIVLPKSTLDSLKELSRREGATLFMTVMAAFSVLLTRYSGQEDVVVGTPIAGRNRAELEHLIGFFVNMLPLRIHLAGNPSFRQLMARVKEAALGAYAHQDVPFEKLVEELKLSRDLSRNPVFQVMFAFQNVTQQRLELPGLSVEPFRAGKRSTAKFDLSLSASDSADGLSLAFEYNTDLFEAWTIERMARSFHALLTAIAENADRSLSEFPLLEEPLRGIARTERLRPSLAQERLWFVDQLEPQSSLHNLPLVLRLTGPLDVRALRNALNRILARHECLRTWFKSDEAGIPVQMITTALEVDLRVHSLTSVPERMHETEARQLVSAEVNSPFDLATGPLIRVLLVKLLARDHVLVINTHRIISDRASLDVLHSELVRFYQQEVDGDIAAPAPLPIQYADFAAWQRQSLSAEGLQEQLRYWKQKLRGAPASLDLPIDRPRPPEQSYGGANSMLEIPNDLTQQLLAIGHGEGTTLFVTLLAAFDVLLSRYSGQDDIVVGSPVTGRSRPELDSLIGLLANHLVLRTPVAGNESFRQLLRNVRETVMQAYAHQDLPFERLVEVLKPERDLSRTPLFQVMFAVENPSLASATIRGLEVCRMEVAGTTSRFDLTVTATEQESGIRLRFEYATALFDEISIQRMQRHWLTLLQAIVANPDCAVADLPLLSDADRNEILYKWNATHRDFDRQVCVHDLVARQAEAAPNAVAVEMGSEQCTYAELNARAERLAEHLRAKGVGPETLVGIYLERSIDLVTALLGTLKAGGAYVPLDPAYPPERIQFILEDAQIGLLLTQPELADKVPATGATLLDVHAALKDAAGSKAPIDSRARPEHLAYVLYTSGSTGKPKGVQITHGNLTNFLISMQREPGFTAADTLLAVTTISFDIAGLELHLPLVSGGRVVLASREEAADARALRYLLELHRPTVMQATPATWRMLIESGWEGASNLKVLCGGEALPADLALPLVPRCGELWNMYGPTETTVWSSTQWVRDVTGTAPIGRPIANTTFYILDSQQQPVPIGVAGELYIGGEGVARGYLNRPELTAERFTRDPFSKKEEARMYRTGDLARYLRDGTVQYLGRTDFQVKVRGFRIELGEIENQLAKHSAVQQVVVAAREDAPGDKRLVAYVVPKSGEHLSLAECRAHLKQSLPDYMLPSAVVELAVLPLTPNGKVDRKSLPEPNLANSASAGAVTAARDPLEEKLLALWRGVLKNPAMGVTDNFFDLGGHSLLAAQLMSEIENSLGRKIPMAVLFRGATVAEMATVLREGTESRSEPIAMRIQAGRTPRFFAAVAPDMDSIGYAALAQAMGPQQTFYKLQLHRTVKPDAPISLDEMRAIARDYVQAMRTVQPRGPYYIGGMCAGTHIGEQMILQLEAEGEKVAMFAIFDTWVRQNSHVRWKWRIYYYRQRLRGMLRMSLHQQVKMIGDALSKKLHRVASGQKRVETSFAKLYWPGKDFKKPHFQAPVALFKRPKQPFYYINDETMGWGERSQGGVHIYRIDFPHQMLREPYIRDVAKHLLECISRATPVPIERLQVWPRVSDQTPSAIDVEA